MPGTLYICATPIGNLEDITLRALRILKEVDVIVAEDSRRTRQLLAHYGITTPLAASLYQGVEQARVDGVLALLENGRNVALVSDAGTPLVSDPGFPLVRACIHAGIPVVPVPGPSAVLASLVASGLPPDRFLFAGYPPRRPGEKKRWLREILAIPATVIFFESPQRLLSTLKIVAELDPARPTVVARELTKIHEEFVRGEAQTVYENLRARERVRGECVVLLGPATKAEKTADPQEINALYAELLGQGFSPREARKEVARRTGYSRREVYQIVLRRGEKDKEGP
ncbi:MAG: 16S rRNA (cytidine(1402)-2'-O)-methyltransferase [Candidatus Bipolaricaulota bacterium]|nr:16S rRNA (cytidine(1402)-2'-O)-methyltransferase [Candidatus Bipolaricaulota bacterium]MDW8127218.1 16S rRNA (cytidine(1402)-2'-O)-methyltransferase [Candidatus Bipolaricaulota bacterium]